MVGNIAGVVVIAAVSIVAVDMPSRFLPVLSVSAAVVVVLQMPDCKHSDG